MSVDYRRLINGGTALPLDLWPNSAAAYSLRKLRHQYTGPAIRVRRSSDNLELDINFLADNYLDVQTLVSFVGAGTGSITTWYDQSTNARHGTQIDINRQPRIIVNGNLQMKNNRPVILTEDTDQVSSGGQYINIPLWHNANDTHVFMFSVYSNEDQTPTNFPWLSFSQQGTTTGGFSSGNNNNRNVQILVSRSSNNNFTGTLQFQRNINMLRVDTANRVNVQSWVNNVQHINASDNNTNFNIGTGYTLGGTNNIGNSGRLTLTEFLFFNTDQLSNRLAITNNINSYYNIF